MRLMKKNMTDIDSIISIAKDAGKAILSVYNNKNFKVQTYHLNTKFRDDYYKTPSSKCNIPMTDTNPFQAVRLSQICLPNSWYVFSNLLENNYSSV